MNYKSISAIIMFICYGNALMGDNMVSQGIPPTILLALACALTSCAADKQDGAEAKKTKAIFGNYDNMEQASIKDRVQQIIASGGFHNSLELISRDELALWRAQADQNLPEAQLLLAYYCIAEMKYADANKWFLKAAEQGLKEAQHMVAYNNYTDKKYADSMKWYLKAAEQGYAPSIVNIGQLYASGYGVEKNSKTAMQWYLRAAALNDAKAMANIGACYRDGEGVGKDLGESYRWYLKSAELGYADAQIALGSCYERGEGVAENSKEAFKWYQKAADQDEAFAQFLIGNCYENGIGTAKSQADAIWWYRKAAAGGCDDAKKRLNELNISLIAS